MLMYGSEEEGYLHVARCLLGQRRREGRNGVVRSGGPAILEFDLREGFPLLTTKKVHFKSVVAELLWFLSGSTNTNDLDATIWDEWANEDGDLGPVYGKQWRDFGGVDQILQVQESIRNDPYSRRHVVSAWNPGEISQMALPPCHILHQYRVNQDGGLDLTVYQRSADWFLGVPFNIASYALLLRLMAKSILMPAHNLYMVFNDAHIYENHAEQMTEQVGRELKIAPVLLFSNRQRSVVDYKAEDFYLDCYYPHPAIKAKVSK